MVDLRATLRCGRLCSENVDQTNDDRSLYTQSTHDVNMFNQSWERYEQVATSSGELQSQYQLQRVDGTRDYIVFDATTSRVSKSEK